MADPAARYTDEFERETAGYVISTGRPISGCRREVGLDSQTVNRWAIKRGRGLSGQPDPKVENRHRPPGTGAGHGVVPRTDQAGQREPSHGRVVPRASVSENLTQIIVAVYVAAGASCNIEGILLPCLMLNSHQVCSTRQLILSFT